MIPFSIYSSYKYAKNDNLICIENCHDQLDDGNNPYLPQKESVTQFQLLFDRNHNPNSALEKNYITLVPSQDSSVISSPLLDTRLIFGIIGMVTLNQGIPI